MDIKKENVPCWYRLSYDPQMPAIVLGIHKDFLENNFSILQMTAVSSLLKEYKLRGFQGDLRKDFGFKEALFENQGKRGEFAKYIIKIPKLRTKTKNPCQTCKGMNPNCLYCGGTGKEFINERRPIQAFVSGFSVLFLFFTCVEKETSSTLPQLMTLRTIANQGHLEIAGEFSLPLVGWLRSLYKENDTRLPGLEEAMKVAYRRMFADSREPRDQFKACIKNKFGSLFIDCPGQNCEVSPSRIEEIHGYEFESHNISNPMQQIALLSGLAWLHGESFKRL